MWAKADLGAERAAKIRLISADAAEGSGEVASTACPDTTLCLGRFDIVRWSIQALNAVHRRAWNTLRRMAFGDRVRHGSARKAKK